MNRITPRFLPIVKIYAAPSVARRGFYREWMAAQLEEGAYLRPGVAHNVQWLKIGEETDFDASPDRPTKTRALALCCDYNIKFRGTKAQLWTHTPSAQERAAIEFVRQVTNDKIGDIQTQLAADPAPTGTTLEDLNAALNVELTVLEQIENGTGFLDTARGALGTGSSGIFWRMQLPNVPVEMTETVALDEDRAISFRLLRSAAPDEQATFEWECEVEAGNTCYSLLMGSDGNSTEWRHYRSMSKSARQKLRADWIRLLDLGRLTVADKTAILAQERAARAIRETVKARQKAASDNAATGDKKVARKDAGETKDETFRLNAIDKEIDRIRGKQRTPAQEAELQEAENALFLARESFQLQESATSLIGTPVDVTIQFLRSGYVVIRSGDDKYVYENKRLTSLPTPFNRQLPKGARLTIRSSGGQWLFVPGAPKWKDAIVLSQPWECDHDFADSLTWKIVGDTTGDAEMDYRVVERRAPTATQPGLYQLELKLKSGGKHTPELYYIGIHRAASEAVQGALLWDSSALTSLTQYGLNRVIDVLLQDDKRRARLAQIVVNGGDSLPQALMGCECEVLLIDRWSEGELVTVVGAGYVSAHETGRVKLLTTESEFAFVQLHGSHTTLPTVGTEEFLNQLIDCPVPPDGEFPNDALRRGLRDAGLPVSWWYRIPQGDAGYSHIPPTKPGAYPAGKPSGRTTWLEHFRDIVRGHCEGAEFWSDALGLRLDDVSGRDLTARGTYGTPATGVGAQSSFCLRGIEGFKLTQDNREYVTSCTATGKRDEKTGRRYCQTETIPQATSEQTRDSVYYIGHDIAKDITDETLDNDAKCLRAARQALNIHALTQDGLAPWWLDTTLDLDPTVSTGDLVSIFGLNWVLDSIEFGALNAGDDGQQMKVNFQLAQDATRLQLEELGQ